MRPKPLSVKAFILPALIIALFCAAAVFDYKRQHTHVRILGKNIDISSVAQILVKPIGSSSASLSNQVTLTDRASILSACHLLGSAKEYMGNQSDFATNIDTMLIETRNRTIRVPIAQTQNHVKLLFFNGNSYVMPIHLLEKLQQLAISHTQSGS